jgi:hypothetical protein
VNVNCSEGENWQREKRAVALISIPTPTGSRWCSGALLNTTLQDNTPYFLTACHCYTESSAQIAGSYTLTGWTFYWDYEYPGCENSSPPLPKSTVGAHLTAAHGNIDFALLLLTQDPHNLANFTPYYLGWDKRNDPGTGGVCIHHPSGDVKKIATYNITPYLLPSSSMDWAVKFMNTDNGHSVIEHGSSGAPLLNSNHRVIGQLLGFHGTEYTCDYPERQVAVFAKFNTSWTGNHATNKVNKLQPWLSPAGHPQVDILDGKDACKDRNNADLMIRDTLDDIGEEPNQVLYMWNSPDIWMRRSDDNGMEHQNPEYNPGTPNYVYVRVKNVGCAKSDNSFQVHLHWAKAGTSLAWPSFWDGNHYFPNNVPKGGLIGSPITVPNLDPGEEAILKFPWVLPNPIDYEAVNSEPWHFCLLARIESTPDPITHTETVDLNYNVSHNNNIAWRNLSIIDVEPNNAIGAAISVGNIYPKEEHAFNLSFTAQHDKGDKFIFKEAEVSVRLDDIVYTAWKRGGKKSRDVEVKGNTVFIRGEKARLENLLFKADEVGTLYLQFNFLTKKITDTEKYVCHVIQTDAKTEKTVGGETYVVNKYPRNLFYADAGEDVIANKDEIIRLSAVPIGEPAIYNWYDQSGKLVCEHINFDLSVSNSEKYTLEVIALADGYKDYAEVSVTLNPNKIVSVYPNPVSEQITVAYKINEAENAYLTIANYYYTSIFKNYDLDTSHGEITLNLSDYPAGIYTVTLMCDGKIANSKVFVKQK